MRGVVGTTALSALLNALKVLAGVLVAKVVALNAGPSGVAVLGQLQSYLGGLAGVCNAPLGTCLVRYTATSCGNSYEECQRWWRASFLTAAVLLLVASGASAIFAHEVAGQLLGSRELWWVVLLLSVLQPLSSVAVLIASTLNGLQEYRRLFSVGVIATLTSTLLGLALISVLGFIGALVAVVVMPAVNGITSVVLVRREAWFRRRLWLGGADIDATKAVTKYVAMAACSAIVGPLLAMSLRTLLIERYGWVGAGEWQAVFKISETYISFVTVTLSAYYLPRLSTCKDVTEVRLMVRKAVCVTVPSMVVLGALIYWQRTSLIELLYSGAFVNAEDLFLWQLPGDFFRLLGWLYAVSMITRGAMRWFIASEVGFSVFQFSMSVVLIESLGVPGVNLAYSITYLIYWIFSAKYIDRFTR